MIIAQREQLTLAKSEVTVGRLEIERLKLMLAKARREQLGQSSERGKLLVEQLELAIEDLEETQASRKPRPSSQCRKLPNSSARKIRGRRDVRCRTPHLAVTKLVCDTGWQELIGGGGAMANAMLDARQEGDSYRRVEVITGERRRRRWTSEEKARIAAESFEEGANISEVARRNGVSRGLLTVWRRQVAAALAGKAQNFVPIQIGAESDGGRVGKSECISPVQTKPVEIATPPAKVCGVVEIEVNGARIRVEPGVELATLSVVLSGIR
ncbi:hypothetical protein CI41S_30360 [Bradyrhizobium ivorense]|nr:hypothetical protein CI41S_30360 [Bradyrhizobium ivorense]